MEEVYPDRVVRNEAGEIERQQQALDEQRAAIATLQSRLDRLDSQPR